MDKSPKYISRRDFLKIASFSAGASFLAACGGSGGQSTVDAQPSDKGKELVGCKLSNQDYPNSSVTGIAESFGQGQIAYVEVDQNNNGTVDYKGPAVNGPVLQYNTGPIGLDGQPVWEAPIQDNVCVFKE